MTYLYGPGERRRREAREERREEGGEKEDRSLGENAIISGFLDIANSSDSVTGVNSKFTTELKIGDSISFTNDSGTTEIKTVEAIISDNILTLDSNVAAQSTKTVATRRRAKLQEANKNISIFKLPYDNIKTLKTASNSNITDTSFAVRRQFIVTLSGGSGQITAGTNESFPSSANDLDYTISIQDVASATDGATEKGVAGFNSAHFTVSATGWTNYYLHGKLQFVE